MEKFLNLSLSFLTLSCFLRVQASYFVEYPNLGLSEVSLRLVLSYAFSTVMPKQWCVGLSASYQEDLGDVDFDHLVKIHMVKIVSPGFSIVQLINK